MRPAGDRFPWRYRLPGWPGVLAFDDRSALRRRRRRALAGLSFAALVLVPLTVAAILHAVGLLGLRGGAHWVPLAPLPPRLPLLGPLLDGRPAARRADPLALVSGSPDGGKGEADSGAAGDLHLVLGVDPHGHAVLDRLLLAFASFIVPGSLAVAVAIGLGVTAGTLLSYPRGLAWTKGVLGAVVDLVASTPRLLILLAIGAGTSFDLTAMMAGLGVLNGPRIVGAVGHQIGLLRQQGLLDALREAGIPPARILWRHVYWAHCRHLFLILASVGLADALMTEATLSALRYGGQRESWGAMVFQGRVDVYQGIYWTGAVPLAAIVLTLLALYALADALSILTARRG